MRPSERKTGVRVQFQNRSQSTISCGLSGVNGYGFAEELYSDPGFTVSLAMFGWINRAHPGLHVATSVCRDSSQRRQCMFERICHVARDTARLSRTAALPAAYQGCTASPRFDRRRERATASGSDLARCKPERARTEELRGSCTAQDLTPIRTGRARLHHSRVIKKRYPCRQTVSRYSPGT
jgi:hypothetical protein